MSTRGRWLLAVLVLALAAMAAVVAQLLFIGSPRVELARYDDPGYLTVLTDDPDAVVNLHQRVVIDPGSTVPEPAKLLDVDVVITRKSTRSFSWAVVTGGGTRLPCLRKDCLEVDPSGDPRPRSAQRGQDQMWLAGNVDTADYLRNANLTFGGLQAEDPPPSAIGSVYVGTATGAEVTVSLTGPTAGPLWYWSNENLRTRLPTLGVDRRYFVGTYEQFLSSPRARDVRLYAGSEGRSGIDPKVLSAAEDTDWSLPATQTTELQLGDGRPPPAWLLTSSDPTPRAPEDWDWYGPDVLNVAVAVEDTDLAADRQEQQFVAGALVGVAGGLLVWGLEMAVTTFSETRRRRAQQASPREP